MRISACVLALLVATIPAAVVALGLGNVEVATTLNEPLRAKIPLTRVTAEEVDAIDVRLGTQEQFERAGLERPFYLSQLKFKVVPDGAGAHVEVTTQNPVVEPFLNFLVEINWPRGRMIREYTLLLDPPVYGAAITTASKSSVATVETLPEPGQMPSTTRVTAPEPAPAPSSSMGTSASAVAPPDLAGVDSYGPVVAQETLWSIATRVRPDESVSIQRMMLAILEANPEAFLINNINALKKGAVLRIPERGEIGADEKDAAMAEVRRQQALWDEYRSQLAGAPAPMPEGAAAPSTGAGGTGTGASGTGEETSRLELVASGQAEGAGAPGDTQSVEALRERLNLALEEADSKQRENQELSDRLEETERLISDLNRMLELKDDEIAQLQESLRAQEGAAAPEPQPQAAPEPQPMPEPEPMPTPEPEAAAPEPAPAPAPEPAPEPEPAPKPAPPPPPPKPTSMVDDILNTVRGFLPKDIFGFDPILVVGGGLGLLLILGGAGALVRRRNAAEEVEVLDIGEGESMIERYAAESDDGVTEMPEGPAPDEDATMLAGSDEVTERPDAGGETMVEGDEDDPLGELNVYMAYEHFDQAEELVRGAIAEYPDRHEYRLKLLGVFAAAKDLPSFQEAARELRDQVGEDSPMMQSAAEMWNGIAPGRDMFAGPQDAETAVDAESDDVFDVTSGDDDDADASVDFDLGFELTGGEEGDADGGSGVDFDLDSGEEAPAEEAAGEDSDEIDFDLGETADGDEAQSEAVAGDDFDETVGTSDLDFDLGGDETTDESAEDEEGLDFDLSGDASGELAGESAEAEDEGLDFDLSGGADDAEEPAESGDEAAAASSDDEALDFDIGGDEPDAADSGDDSGLDFDIGGDEPEAAASDDDSGLDFDIGGDDAETVESVDDSGLDLDAGGDEPEAAASDDDSGLDFDIGGDDAETAESADDSGLDLDAGDDEPEAMASDDDSGLDFDIGGDDESAPAQESQPGIDTVHLGQQKVGEIESASEDSGEDSGLDFDIGGGEDADDPDVGIDTQFTDVFADSGDGGDDLSLDMDTGSDEGAGDESAALDSEAGAGESEDSGLDLDLGGGDASEAGTDDDEDGFEATQFMLRDVAKPDEDAGDDDDDDKTIALKRSPGEVDDIQTKLDLAEAYIEMGDQDGARGILSEVMNEGSDEQKEQANNLLSKLD